MPVEMAEGEGMSGEGKARYEVRWGSTSQMWGIWDLKKVNGFLGWLVEEGMARELVRALNEKGKR